MSDYLEKLHALYTDKQLNLLIEKKLSEYSHLISRDTALFLIAKENNCIIEETVDSSSLHNQQSRFSIIGTIVKIFPPYEHTAAGTSESRTKTKSQRLWLSDEKGVFTLVLWNEKTNLTSGTIGLGDKIKIVGAYFRDGEVHLSASGRIEKLEPASVTRLSDLNTNVTNAICVEGSITEVYPDYYYKNSRGEEVAMRSFDITDGTVVVNVSVWHDPQLVAKLQPSDRIRLENVKFRRGGLHVNSNSRLILLERKEAGRIEGVVEDISLEKDSFRVKISGETYQVPFQLGWSLLLGLFQIPPDVSPSTILDIKKNDVIGKKISINLQQNRDGNKKD
ncbi:MAG: hypothetical protein QXW70_02615 [Candidatus Anstonellales archaeon]